MNTLYRRPPSLNTHDPKFQEEAWDLEITWINTGKVEDLDKSLADKRIYEYKQREWRREHGYWTHRIHVSAKTMTFMTLASMQRQASKIGALGSEEIGSKEEDGITLNDVKFNFCIISDETDEVLVAKHMLDTIKTNGKTPYPVNGLTVVAEVLEPPPAVDPEPLLSAAALV